MGSTLPGFDEAPRATARVTISFTEAMMEQICWAAYIGCMSAQLWMREGLTDAALRPLDLPEVDAGRSAVKRSERVDVLVTPDIKRRLTEAAQTKGVPVGALSRAIIERDVKQSAEAEAEAEAEDRMAAARSAAAEGVG